MTSEARVAANRRNAQKSTGPRTSEGKARSSRNALKHGLRAEVLCAPDFAIVGESPDEFADLLAGLVADFAPVGAMEEVLVETVAVSLWRLRRSLRVENGEIVRRYHCASADDPSRADRCSLPDTDRLNAIIRYEAHVQRQLDRALRQLAAVRHTRELRQSLERLDGQQAHLSPWERGRGRGSSDDPDLFNLSRGGLPGPATFHAELGGSRPPAPNRRRVRTAACHPAERTQSGLDHPAAFQGGGREEHAPATGRPPTANGRQENHVLSPAERTQRGPLPPESVFGHPPDPALPPAAEVPSAEQTQYRPAGRRRPRRSAPEPSSLVQALTAAITSQLFADHNPARSPSPTAIGEGSGVRPV